ncbi:hypothetical protein [Leptospira santarosai]|uniref:hypothetical protein n=1 Tax=Leptospira santarosai TaxID=28183 RepID=UPI0024AF2CC1|nr:hypothetical protein [Leptospira santarosai]MDI7174644.1 hypothetical protein [Leptospira santarosai]MDI7194381.1 hypothetical protein [Leptospira santarosai]MDO6398696.1 hypothetical protein [Leptospira santarosai]MDO6404223.1 hypothetical protein [Leptospira santarosai]
MSESISLGIDSEYFSVETSKIAGITKWFQHDAVGLKYVHGNGTTKKRFTPLRT